MRQTLKTSKRIGLLVLALGLMALSATTAQAETGAYWEVKGTKIEGASELLPKFNLKKDTSHLVLLFSIAKSTIDLDCTEIKMVNGLLHKSGKTTGKLHLGNCITKFNGTDALCKPHSPGAAVGLIETNALNGLLKLHKENEIKDDLLELSPVEGETFATVALGPTGKECLFLLDENAIKGKLFLRDGKKELSVNTVEHLLEEQKSLTKLRILGSTPVTMDGSFWAFLVGSHEGLQWSGHTA
jgi:hypothetical protein